MVETVGSRVKVWDGKTWIDKVAKVYKGNGQWAYSTARHWDGVKWAYPYYPTNNYTPTPPPAVTRKQTQTAVYTATWGASYDGDNNIRSYTQNRLYQGKYGKYDPTANITHNPVLFGVQRSLIGFDYSKIQSDMVGATIEKVELYLHIEHAWYYAGATASICTHRATSKPNKFDYIHRNVGTQKYNSRNEGHWISISSNVWKDLAGGSITGFGLYTTSADQQYYGYWHGAGTSKPPKIRITYSKVIQGTNTVLPTSPSYTSPVSTPKAPVLVEQAKYFSVPKGWGLVQVTEELMRRGYLSSNFFEARKTLMDLNNFSTSAPMLHPGDQIRYKAAKYK